ncbi:MAG: hypothetical protein LIP01_00810, partial [Tannerellaceae bacterium]|nr:hypothetical protein [Tannerellaceae bacterium]
MKQLNLKYYFFLFLLMIPCHKIISQNTGKYDSIKKWMLPFLQEQFGEDISTKPDSILFHNLHFYGEADIYNLGRTQIFKNYTDGPSEAEKGTTYFFIGENNTHSLLAVEDSIFFVKIKNENSQSYVATFFNLRGKAFQIYHYTNNSFQQVFDSWDDSGYLTYIPLTTYSWEVPDPLLGRIISHVKFENTDINGDGWLDMKFSGMIEAPDYDLYN